jgi:hypothetical protein
MTVKIGDEIYVSRLGNLIRLVVIGITFAGASAKNPKELCYKLSDGSYIVESALTLK